VRNRRENGIALITALLILLLVSSIIIGLSWMVMTDQRLGGNNSDRQNAFYAAEAGMEKMTADIGELYTTTSALSSANITTVMAEPPVIPGVSYTTATGASGYLVTYTHDANGNPAAANHTILTGAYSGLQGMLTPFNLSVTARLNSGAEAKLTRVVQTVGIPVFQFGIFCQYDCSTFAGPTLTFGGRVHSNANLWLSAGGTTTFADKVTASGQVITTNLSNGNPTSNGYTGTVQIDTTPENSATATALTMGSVTGSSVVGSIGPSNSAWASYSTGSLTGQMNSSILTGTPVLTLTVATPGVGGTPIELIRRPVAGENTSNPAMLAERYFSLASLRIMLSDYGPSNTCTDADMVGLPTVTATTPIDLESLAWNSSRGKPVASAPAFLFGLNYVYPLPTSGAGQAGVGLSTYSGWDGYWISQDRPIINGCLKIEYQSKAGGSWTDVTQEILKLGYTGRNLNPQSKTTMQNTSNYPPYEIALPGAQVAPSTTCADPSPNAVIRLARLRDNPSGAIGAGGCGTPPATGGQQGTDYWPNVLFDPREATSRDLAPPSITTTLNGTNATPVTAAGVMNYVELDANNLSRWFMGTIGSSGTLANNTTGYTVYFSDRRGSRTDPVTARNTGSYGYNDIVNPSSPAGGCPNNTMDMGEDMVLDGVLRTYGGVQLPFYTTGTNSGYGWTSTPTVTTGTSAFLTGAPALAANGNCSAQGTTWPGAVYGDNQDARENPPLYFRRALKVVNGSVISIGTCNTVPCGLTVSSENPLYLQGDFNNTAAAVGTSVVADAVAFLSDNWNDVNSFAFPYNFSYRLAANTSYRVADISGKGVEFPQVTGTANDYGTDGGIHNFLRYIENWSTNTLTYEGSMVSFYYSQQLVGPFKCCTDVYSPPTRNFSFDTNFLTPSLLPPRTPMLRDVDTIGFSQVTSPAQ
jgi:hypothetical protein